MRVDTARKWIRQNLPRLQKRFKLEDWELTFEIFGSNEDEEASAKCHPSPDYQWAIIEVWVSDISSERNLEMIISHELLHCVLSPIDHIRDLIDDLSDDSAKVVMYKYYHSTIERTVRNLELILNLGIKSAKIV